MLIFEFVNGFSAAHQSICRLAAENRAAIAKMAAGSKELQDVCTDMAHSCVTKIIFI